MAIFVVIILFSVMDAPIDDGVSFDDFDNMHELQEFMRKTGTIIDVCE